MTTRDSISIPSKFEGAQNDFALVIALSNCIMVQWES